MDTKERHELIKNIVLARYPYLDSKSEDEYEQKEWQKARDEVRTLCAMTDEQLTNVVLALAPRLEAQLYEPLRRMVKTTYNATYTTSPLQGYTKLMNGVEVRNGIPARKRNMSNRKQEDIFRAINNAVFKTDLPKQRINHH